MYVSCPYSDEHSCAKAKKSLERIFRKSGDYQLPTNGSDSIGPGDYVAGPKSSDAKLDYRVTKLVIRLV